MAVQTVKLALLQQAMAQTPEAMQEKTLSAVKTAARAGAQCVLLQELFRTPYFCQEESTAPFAWAESADGPTVSAFAKLAKAEKIVVVVPFFEKRAPGLYHNSAAVIDADGSVLGIYRKMHIPDDPQYYEKFYFTPGDLGFRVWKTRYAKIGVLICWDQWFPEAARLTALQGADILVYPTAIGWHQSQSEADNRAQHEAWETVQRGHAVANGVFVAAANRVGVQGEQRFWGGSFVADPFGRLLAKGSVDREETLHVEIDLEKIAETRENWPFLRDRRIDAYGDIARRFVD